MKNVSVVILLLVVTACQNYPPPKEEKELEHNVDTVIRRAEEANQFDKTISDFKEPGMWLAKVVTDSQGNKFQIWVMGDVNVGNPEAKLNLVKDTSASESSELVLNLSAAPVNEWGAPASVEYSEQVKTLGRYKKIRIMHKDKKVYVITKIDGVE